MSQFSTHSNNSDLEFEQLSLDVGLTSIPPIPDDEAPSVSEHLQEDSIDSLAHYSFGADRKDLPGEEHPRHRLHMSGASTLSTSDLLTVILGSSSELGQRLVQILSTDGFTPLGHLRDVTVEELTTVPGIGPAKAAVIIAAVELGKRLFMPKPAHRTVIDEPKLVVDVLAQELMWKRQEHLAVVLLDVKHHSGLLTNKVEEKDSSCRA